MSSPIRPRAWEQARRDGRHVFYEEATETIRQCPENYLLAVRRDGRFNAAPDKASPINGHSLGIVLDQFQGGSLGDLRDKPEELARAIQSAFWGD